ncbi:hypothetical protein EXIGLDRAFT_314418 [Exidia glandulosa HHB12029]|uniref:Wax synthase domain-containing protein n=1 Tax=Exidia glandulosa HHB12029 TaxID=1314781 RepID=A0A165CYE6_EXIGL|nr:hypothetical protein EXIGLDRAFT_314418 [Exidia glandulosa HHB12029]
MSVSAKDFFGSLRIPVRSFPSVTLGFLLLCACNYTWTSPRFASTATRALRILLGVPAILGFYDFAYGDYGAQGRLTTVGMAVIIQCALVGLHDTAPPRWVSIRTGKVLPMPVTLRDRVVYAVDLSTSLRGTSWLPDTNWDWISRTVHGQQQRMIARGLTRRIFMREVLATFVLQYLTVDAFDTVNKGRDWDTRSLYPVTSLPWLEQLPRALSVCVGTVTAIVVEHSIISALFVGVLGAPVEGWPSMFDAPFSATSLADLWTNRWHSIFRQSFNRLSLPILWIIPQSAGRGVRRFCRALAIFCLSALFHVLFMHRLETNELFIHPNFLDLSILKFFLLQPLFLALEWLVIAPLARRFLPERWQTVPTRIFAWSSLLFTGRYWADVWARRGLWGHEEKVVGASIVRGLWKGDWIVR